MNQEMLKLGKYTRERIESFNRFAAPLHDEIKESHKLYRGTFFADEYSLERNFYYDCKLIYSIIQGFIPSIIISDPEIILRPRKESSVPLTAVTEAVSNYYWHELAIKEQLKKTVLDTYIAGFGVFKQGWQFKIDYRNKKLETDDPSVPKDFAADEYVQVDNPFVKRICPQLFMWDPQARDIDSARWVGEKIIKPKEEVLNNPNYDKEALKDIEGSEVGLQDYIFAEQGLRIVESDPDKYICLYEVHDKERGKIITMAEHSDVPLRVIDYPYPNIEGSHYTMLVLHPMPDKVEGISFCQLLRDQQIMLNRVRTLQAAAAKRSARIYAVDPEAPVDEKQIRALQNAEHGAVVRIAGNSIKPVDHAPLPQELFAVGDISVNDILRTAGSPPSRIGMPAGGRTSATEINQLQSVEQFRLEDARTVVADFAAKVTKKLIQITANKLSDEKVIMIVGEEEAIPFKFTREQLKGEFDYIIEAESMSRTNRDVERQQMMAFLNMTAQLPEVNKVELVKRIAKSYGWKDLTKLFQAPAPAMPPQGQLTNNMQASPPDSSSMIANASMPSGGTNIPQG